MTTQTGIIYNEPASVYHASPAFGSHDIGDINDCPLFFYKRHVEKSLAEEKNSAAFAFGRYFHCLALEGEDVADQLFEIAPSGIDRRTKEGKAAWAAFEASANGREVVTAQDEALAWEMLAGIQTKRSLTKLLDPAIGKPEVTFRVQFKHFQLQCRADWFIEKPEGGGPPLIIDVKTIDKLADFKSHYFKYGYYRQLAFYRGLVAKAMGLQESQPQVAIIAVEKSPCYQAKLFIPDAQSLEIGWSELMSDLGKINDCFAANSWPGVPDEVEAVGLPNWKVQKEAA